MTKSVSQRSVNDVLPGLALSVFLGLICYFLTVLVNSPMLDPLVISLITGITVRSAITDNKRLAPGISFASSLFIPFGIVFYGLNHLNFAKLTEVEPVWLILLLIVMLVYFFVISALGRLLKQKKQITYLTASGSAICGASAIAVTSPALDAEPDDVSISLLSVAMAAFFGFAVILPFVSAILDLTCRNYCLLSGSVLQFTGLVKVAENYMPFLKHDAHQPEMLSVALSMKAIRYLGLIVAVPVFSSFIKKRVSVPWFLWAFVGAGLIGTFIYSTGGEFFASSVVPYIKPVHNISWSAAMAAIGLHTDFKKIFSDYGAKALIMAFAGFLAAVLTFITGLYIINSF